MKDLFKSVVHQNLEYVIINLTTLRAVSEWIQLEPKDAILKQEIIVSFNTIPEAYNYAIKHNIRRYIIFDMRSKYNAFQSVPLAANLVTNV